MDIIGLEAKQYILIETAISSGVEYAIHRLFKYRETDTITRKELIAELDNITDNIMLELSENFDFKS